MPHCVADILEMHMAGMLPAVDEIDPCTKEYLQIKDSIEASGYLAKYLTEDKNGTRYKKIEICTNTAEAQHIATLWLENKELKTTILKWYIELKAEERQQNMENLTAMLYRKYRATTEIISSDSP
ncbi:MAG: hypothetical protein KAI53_00045 [Candidatus Aenigmarchaeota archaeon]|nr:hypothetical protein [Candidatus Aenigmarchaeota archaeon]